MVDSRGNPAAGINVRILSGPIWRLKKKKIIFLPKNWWLMMWLLTGGHSLASEDVAVAASRKIRLMDDTDGTWEQNRQPEWKLIIIWICWFVDWPRKSTWLGSHRRWVSRISRISDANSDGRSAFRRRTLRTTDGVAICFSLDGISC